MAKSNEPENGTSEPTARPVVFDIQKLTVTTAYQHRVMDVVPVNNLLLLVNVENTPELVVPRESGPLTLTVDGLRNVVEQCYVSLFVDPVDEDDF